MLGKLNSLWTKTISPKVMSKPFCLHYQFCHKISNLVLLAALLEEVVASGEGIHRQN